jgi:geranylgeranyl transferase type-2 subunit beta
MSSSSDFYLQKHIDYIRKVSADKESIEYLATEHLRMSGVYWGLTAIALLGVELTYEKAYEGLIDWIMSAYDPVVGGFGGNYLHDPHILYTLSAVQILALFDKLSLVDIPKVKSFIASLQQSDGSFYGDKWGEVDTRFSYCALSTLSILGELHSGAIDLEKATEFVGKCRNFDGGFGAVPGAESHAAQCFCCVGALSIGGALHLVDADLLGWWLSERQCDSGGLNGRPEKQADVCYSWWILSTLSILGRTSWIDKKALEGFILRAQDDEDGGIADRPGDMADIFHTFFGICGLSLINYFESNEENHPEYEKVIII